MTLGEDILTIAEKVDQVKSAQFFRWELKPFQEKDLLHIMQQHAVSEPIARCLAVKGLHATEVKDFLHPTIKHFLPDPFHLLDMHKAVECCVNAIKDGKTLCVFGDYDVDGATSSSLLILFMRELGIEMQYYIPDRQQEGYGPNSQAMQALRKRGVDVIITVDCGAMAFEALASAKACGLEVIVLDHHLGAETLPEAVAVVNPNRLDETSSCTHLAAVGVTFLFIVGLYTTLKKEEMLSREVNLLNFLDLVALGTVCDVVPLEGINRAFVAQGLKILAARNNTGLTALADCAHMSSPPFTGYHLGFVLGPRINAGGRVGKSSLGTELLTSRDPMAAITLAHELEQLNAERKAIEALVLEEATAQIEKQPPDASIFCVYGQGWHVGVIGIVAGRLKDKLHRPVAVISIDNGVGKASARSIKGMDIGSLIVRARQKGLLEAGGGHAMAAGFTVVEDAIPPLIAFMQKEFLNYRHCYEGGKRLAIDNVVSIHAVTVSLAKELQCLGPFGVGNAEPRFMLYNVRIVRVDIVGTDHLRCILTDAQKMGKSTSLKAMAFRSVQTPLGQYLLAHQGAAVNIVGHIRLNQWNGNESADFFIDDVGI